MYKNYEQCYGPPIPSVQAMRLKLWESHIGCASYNILKNQPNRRWSTVNVVLQASDFLRYLLLSIRCRTITQRIVFRINTVEICELLVSNRSNNNDCISITEFCID